MAKQAWKHFAFICDVLGKVMNASLSLAQDTDKLLVLKGGGRVAKARVKSFAMLATLALGVVLIETGSAAAQPQVKPRTEEGTIAPIKWQPIIQQQETWRKSMVKAARPKKGCFVATYPEKQWREVQCGTPPIRPYQPRNGIRPQTVGNGTDFSAQVTGNISQAEGSFDSVAGVTSVSSGGKANVFSLQLNTNHFPTTVCSGAADSNCRGWEQFIFSSSPKSSDNSVFIQYWLLYWNKPCPPSWNTRGVHCWINSAHSITPPVGLPIAALSQMKIDGATAGVNGNADDTVTLSIGGTLYSAPGDNHFPDLTGGWSISEFNVVGDCCGHQATFNAGSTIVVRTSVNSGMGAPPPTCALSGFTSETNNLTLVAAPAVINDVEWPSIVFTQSNNATTPASCDTADSIGDTHLKTFSGLLYDFQASGDFVLVKDGSDFVVQARQASGAPTWPDAAINKAVAAQMGKTRVALYIEPTRLVIDGQPNDLADGKTLLLPSGVQVSRQGNSYAITSENGDSVRAVLNSSWIDVHVGLGHPQTQARGLLSNHNGNAQELMASNGAVLMEPVSFTDLYHTYGDSWRVQPNESLFTEHTTIIAGIPTKPLFADHLNRQEYARARAICKAARITVPALLDACTLDNAVLNDKIAATVFVHARPPRHVIKPVLRPPVLHEPVVHPTP